jgi:putative endonuclease
MAAFFLSMFSTYIIFSISSQKYYTGHCADVDIRLAQHNAGRNKSTKSGLPWKIVYTCKFSTKAEASALELKIKKRGAKRYLEDMRRIG